jgi:alkanesulfonate monooxygenase SsuD/methylene tetrahydromethanopterin reductase-like flavin-dependent oxidoreductase (luciferase family)
MTLRCGVALPGGTASEQLEQAVLAERAGWDGVFVWEAAYGVDAWSLLAAMAVSTSRITLGTMLTPLPWRRPWKVASQVATLDQLSGGRAVLAVGVGAVTTDLPLTGEELELRTRAAMMDEGIDLIRALWAGTLSVSGPHYSYAATRTDLAEVGRPVQDPVPIWVVAAWPRPKSLRRGQRCEGVIPSGVDRPSQLREMRAWLNRPAQDYIVDGETPADPAAAASIVAPWAEAGCTWWLESRWAMPHHSPARMAEIRDRIAAGPPRPD